LPLTVVGGSLTVVELPLTVVGGSLTVVDEPLTTVEPAITTDDAPLPWSSWRLGSFGCRESRVGQVAGVELDAGST
jgi:hypothetical protein